MNLRLIAIAGGRRSGKDTARRILERLITSTSSFHIAEHLYRQAENIFGLSYEELEDNEKKELFRPFLQWYGTEYLEQFCGHEWREDFLRGKLKELADTNIIVTGIRLHKEITLLRQLAKEFNRKLTIVRLLRNQPHDERLDEHKTEMSVRSLSADVTIRNDGTIADLENELRQWVI